MTTFKSMGLGDPILKAVGELGFTQPTPVQEQVIPQIIQNKQDLIVLAQTGTGKTASFGLPLIQHADLTDRSVQGLVLCPTRELCMQISSDLGDFSKYIAGFNVIPVYGGAPVDRQIQQLKRGGQIVVGTPGRVRDLIDRKVLKVEKIRWLVLDEADEMLQMGFKDELDAILKGTPGERQTLLFSATMPEGVYRIASEYMHAPEEIAVGTKNAGAEHVMHEYYMSHAKHRYEVLKRIADMNPDIYGIVFCRTRRETKEVADKLMADGYNADALHGDLSQSQRDYVMNRFRKRQIQMLVATDVAARGLDVNDLTHVINYNLPDELEAYIHRSGRTGRAGKSGTSVSIIHTRETGKIRQLQKISGKKFSRAMIPGGKEICKKQLFNLVGTMEQVETADRQMDEFMPEIYGKLEGMSKEELIKKFVSVEFNRFLEYYRNAPDLNVEANRRNDRGAGNDFQGGRRDRSESGSHRKGQSVYRDAHAAGRSEKRSNRHDVHRDPEDWFGEGRHSSGKADLTRFYINRGSKNNLDPTKLIGLLLDTTNNREINIGKIDIMKGFSFFEIDRKHEDLVKRSFSRNIRHEGALVKVEVAEGEPGEAGESARSSAKNRTRSNHESPTSKGSRQRNSNVSTKKKHRKGIRHY